MQKHMRRAEGGQDEGMDAGWIVEARRCRRSAWRASPPIGGESLAVGSEAFVACFKEALGPYGRHRERVCDGITKARR